MDIIKYGNHFYIIPGVGLFGEKGHYMYLEIFWLKWGLSFTIYDNE